MSQSVRHVPVGLFGGVMGIAGLGLACREAAKALPVGMTLVAGGLGPYSLALADALWWSGCVLLC
jgi:tellurite resistance protein TehA-like permease